MNGFTKVGHLMWAPIDGGDVYRCDRCRALTDDPGGHALFHGNAPVDRVAHWREQAQITEVRP